MRRLILFGTLFFFAQFLLGQTNVVVVRTTGKVQYTDEQNKKMKNVLAGMEIPASSILNLGKGSTAKLLFSGKPIELKKKGKYELQLLLNNEKSKKQRSFFYRFWDFINEGISNTSDNEKLQKYHQKYMERVTGGISGFGNDARGIDAKGTVQGTFG